jgi:hypothetical protein
MLDCHLLSPITKSYLCIRSSILKVHAMRHKWYFRCLKQSWYLIVMGLELQLCKERKRRRLGHIRLHYITHMIQVTYLTHLSHIAQDMHCTYCGFVELLLTRCLLLKTLCFLDVCMFLFANWYVVASYMTKFSVHIIYYSSIASQSPTFSSYSPLPHPHPGMCTILGRILSRTYSRNVYKMTTRPFQGTALQRTS